MSVVKGFTFFKSYYECLEDLETEDKNEVLNAILDYVFKDKKPRFKGTKKAIWTLIEPNLNTSKNRSNSNSGAPTGNKNACKTRANEGSEETIKKQSKNNQNSTKKQSITSLSLSLSYSLSNSLSYNNNINIKNNNILNNLFIEYLILREENNYSMNEVVIKRLLETLDKAQNDEERKEMMELAITKKWKEFYLINEPKEKDKIEKVAEGVFKL